MKECQGLFIHCCLDFLQSFIRSTNSEPHMYQRLCQTWDTIQELRQGRVCPLGGGCKLTFTLHEALCVLIHEAQVGPPRPACKLVGRPSNEYDS